MSPKLLEYKDQKYNFNANEEDRKHVHVRTQRGKAKFWLEPEIKLAWAKRISETELNEIKKTIGEHKDEFKAKWIKFFG